MSTMNIVIVGGGFAGVKAAIELSKRHLGKITLISDHPYFLHHATLYATATGKSMAESVLPLATIFDYYPGVTVVTDTIVSLDDKKRTVTGNKAVYRYDMVVFAIGSVTTFFNIKGLAHHAFGIKSLGEVKAFNDHIQDEVALRRLDKEYFIIGAGPTGVELAGALKEYLDDLVRIHGLKRPYPKVSLIEAAPRILPRASKTAARKVERRLRSMGVLVKTGQSVQEVGDKEVTIDGKSYASETVIWTSGVMNNPFFAKYPGTFALDASGHVIVDDNLQAAPRVYVLGDNNTVSNSGLAWPALDQGAYIAKHFARIVTKQPLKPYRPREFTHGLPVGARWGYVERWGIYIAGKSGAWARRRIELRGYRQLVPRRIAKELWRAHDIPEIDF